MSEQSQRYVTAAPMASADSFVAFRRAFMQLAAAFESHFGRERTVQMLREILEKYAA